MVTVESNFECHGHVRKAAVTLTEHLDQKRHHDQLSCFSKYEARYDALILLYFVALVQIVDVPACSMDATCSIRY